MSCTWNELGVQLSLSINWRASLVPAAAVIPAPMAYIKVVAVEKLVVECLLMMAGPPFGRVSGTPSAHALDYACTWLCGVVQSTFILKKLTRFWQAVAMHAPAWNNVVMFHFVGFWKHGLANRDSWGHLNFIVRGEILGFINVKQRRKHLPWMFSLIKNES